MLRFIILCLCLLVSSLSFSQYNPTIRTARPGQAVGPFTTGKNIFQIQTGITSDWFDNTTSDVSGNGLGYFLSLRYGLEESFEIRSAFGVRRDITSTNTTESTIGGINVWNVGIRYNIVNGKGKQASYGIQTDVRFNFVDEDYNIDDLAPRIMLIHGQKLGANLGLTTNWGISWNGFNSTPRGFYVINMSFPISDKLGGFVETYGGVIRDDFTIFFDTGLAYLVNNDFQLDISMGYGSNDNVRVTFIDAGISWRTGKWKGGSSEN